MPYKISGNTVMVKRTDKWQVLKKHKTKKEAIAHLRALYANTKKGHK